MNKTLAIVLSVLGLAIALVGLVGYTDKHHKALLEHSTSGFYTLSSLEESSDGSFQAILKWIPGKDFIDNPSSKVLTELKVTLTADNFNEFQLKITDINDTRFTLPYQEPFPFTKVTKDTSKQNLFAYSLSAPGEQFSLKLWRSDNGEVLFDTVNTPIFFQDKYLEISTNLSEGAIFGLGERRTSFKLNSGNYTIWAADAARVDRGTPNHQTYGTHPMYMRRDAATSNFHIVFLRNAYGMEIDYAENSKITYKVIGGNFDFKFFIGDSNPEEPIKLYHNYINNWILHPFWVQGFHQCRWGYHTSQKLEQVWTNFNDLKIPMDSLWSDIDYMYEYDNFSIDTERFVLSQMHQIYNLSDPAGVHWSSIIDVGIAVDSDAATRGQDMNVFIKSAYTGKDLVGNVWPGKTYFPDFNHPNSSEYWYEGLSNITKNYGLVQDGIWIDMNEYSNFVHGEEFPGFNSSSIVTFLKNKPEFFYEEIPYNPRGLDDLATRTLSLNAKHYNKEGAQMLYIPNYNLTQYDMHNLNGLGESIATYNAAKKMGRKLTFILSRSTVFGSGRYVQHWNGDGFSRWNYLKLSIPSILTFQMYGIPLVGEDICGLQDDAKPELCARWMQLGSLYPFSRNHNGNMTTPQEPYAFPRYHYVLNSSIKTLNVRYQLLKFYYHLFVKNNGQGTVFRHLMWEFPSDSEVIDNETQFFLGDFLMAAPVTYPGNVLTNTTKLSVQIPKTGVFYDFYNQKRFDAGTYNLTVPFDAVVPMYQKAGKIVHVQDKQAVLRSRFLDNHFTLKIALDDNLQASGTMLTINDYNDEDNIVNSCQEGNNCVMEITANGAFQTNKKFTLTLENSGEQGDNTIFQEVIIDKVIIAGIPQNGKYISKTVDLSKDPFVITKNSQSKQIIISV